MSILSYRVIPTTQFIHGMGTPDKSSKTSFLPAAEKTAKMRNALIPNAIVLGKPSVAMWGTADPNHPELARATAFLLQASSVKGFPASKKTRRLALVAAIQ